MLLFDDQIIELKVIFQWTFSNRKYNDFFVLFCFSGTTFIGIVIVKVFFFFWSIPAVIKASVYFILIIKIYVHFFVLFSKIN